MGLKAVNEKYLSKMKFLKLLTTRNLFFEMKTILRKIIGLFVLSGCFLLGSCVGSKNENKQDSEDFDRVREIQNQNINNPRDYLRAL